jgi:hypothetical protein
MPRYMDKLFGKAPQLSNFARLFRRGERNRAFLDEPAERQITPGIVCFRGWIAGPDPISAPTLEVGDHSETISTFHERTDVLEATGAAYAVGWHLYVHIPSRAPRAPSIRVRILVGGVSLLERTLTCLGGEHQKVFLDEPRESKITAGIVCFRGWIAGPDPISALTFEIGDHSEVISTFHERTDLLETGVGYAAGWRIYIHISSRFAGADSLKLRIRVGDVSIFEGTLRCFPQGNARTTPLFFCMHIPKTAGTSLRMALDGQPDRLRAVCVYPEDPFISPMRCFELGRAAFDETDVVVGHFPYGFHAISHRPYRYISLVREPFALVMSYYLYAKHVQDVPQVSRYSSIYEAVERSNVVEFDNILIRYFANRLDLEPITEADLLTAKRNIRKDFLYIGTVENIRTSFDRIEGIFGVDIPLLHINKGPDTTISERIDLDELRSRLRTRLSFDLRLYEWIVMRFQPVHELLAFNSLMLSRGVFCDTWQRTSHPTVQTGFLPNVMSHRLPRCCSIASKPDRLK